MSKSLGELGEDRVVERLIRGLPLGKNVIAGPGDDCAVIGGAKDRNWRLLKTDCVIENVHFLRAAEPSRVGWKAVCRAISDVGAMGGWPEEALLTVAVPPDLPLSWLEGFYKGAKKAARKFHVSIVGGETSRSPGPIFINVAMTGCVERILCTMRSGGQPGHLLYVTGRLGGSIKGHHLDFVPRLQEARWLAANFRPSAMMDLSDGLNADLPRLASASGCGWDVLPDRIPCTHGVSAAEAMGDGEDYELLFSISARNGAALESEWRKTFRRLALTRIGQFTAPAKIRPSKQPRGFDHFAPTR